VLTSFDLTLFNLKILGEETLDENVEDEKDMRALMGIGSLGNKREPKRSREMKLRGERQRGEREVIGNICLISGEYGAHKRAEVQFT
jgi:hypothetical protein